MGKQQSGAADQMQMINSSSASVSTFLKAEVLAVCRSGAFRSVFMQFCALICKILELTDGVLSFDCDCIMRKHGTETNLNRNLWEEFCNIS